MNLVIVESPAKAKTIEKYLGKDFKVLASVGHIIDLPSKVLGVDIEHGFKPEYVPMEGKEKVISSIKSEAKKATEVYLASDPDREGEAIAFHLASIIDNKKPIKRVLFNEITKKGIMEGISKPTAINMDVFNAQQARRILDRLVGYLVSPILWKPLKYGLSAGRVQSVALRLICERQQEIENFVPVESWSIDAIFDVQGSSDDRSGSVIATLDKVGGKKVALANEKDADSLLSTLPESYKISKVEEKEVKQFPQPAFTTSTMQQEAIRKLGFSAKRTMDTAKFLYENGYITYPRTDSTRLSEESIEKARAFIDINFGKEYIGKGQFGKMSEQSQDAHEAVRPTDPTRTPKTVKPELDAGQLKLYKLIWDRFIASQMSPAIYARTAVILTGSNLKHSQVDFKAMGRVLKFKGFTALYMQAKDEDSIEESSVNIPFKPEEGSSAVISNAEKLKEYAKELKLDKEAKNALKQGSLLATVSRQHFTTPPPAYTEASLVKALEQEGIGRPSTYVSIISVIVERKYVEVKDKKFLPTEMGRIVLQVLLENFPKIFEVSFTATMEKELDYIAEGTKNYQAVLQEFYKDFDKELKNAEHKKIVAFLKTNITCPECGGELVIKAGKMGVFLACNNYPACKFTSDFIRQDNGEIVIDNTKPQAERTGIFCQACGGEMVIKRTKFGKEMLGCSNYPDCKNILNFLRKEDGSILVIDPKGQEDLKCPTCGKPLNMKAGTKGDFLACSGYPECKFTSNFKMEDDKIVLFPKQASDSASSEDKVEIDEVCDKCGKPMALKHSYRGPFLACTGYPNCKNIKNLSKEEKEKYKIEPPVKEPPKETDIACDKCGKPMVIRNSRRGEFLACSGFPKCRNTKPLSDNK